MSLNRLILGCAILGGAARAQPPIIGRTAELLLNDGHFIAETQGLTLVHDRLVKHPGNPVLVADQPWEKGRLGHTAVMHDVEEGLYQMWYEILDERDYGRLLYAESRDGLAWRKPVLNIVEYEGSKANNLVYVPPPKKKAKAYWVIKDYSDPDPSRRYKMMHHKFDFRGRGVATAESPDGLHWTVRDYSSLVGEFDTHDIMFWDDRVGLFVGYLRARVAGKRSFARATSPDSYHWSRPVVVHGPDENDPADREIYTPGVFKYSKANDVYVMVPAVFDTNTNTVKGQLGVSRDGIRWFRFRDLFLPNGASGEWDAGAIYPIGAEATVKGKTAIYYWGNYLGHVEKTGRPGIGVGFLDEGGFAGWRAAARGTLTTRPIQVEFVQDVVCLNAQASGGSIEAELLDAKGVVIPGFSRADSQPVREDGVMLPLRWKGGKSLEKILRRGAFRVKLYLDKATVYG